MKFLRENIEALKTALTNRGSEIDLDAVLQLDGRRRELVHETEQLRAEQNRANEEIARLKKNKEDAASAIAAMKEVSGRV
ncbi:MAG: serine--tRNA ligase, partial [Candidatus Hydrogenedentes bacterium]|nr:serine--tRNA ligase [Candidatus Hydrogenedentota bacterium]